MGHNQNPFKKIFIITAIYIIFSIIIVFIFIYLNRPYGGQQTNINGLTNNSSDAEILNTIKYNLYQVIQYNNSSVDPSSVSDVNIRKDSRIDNYNKDTNVHTVFFLIDIPSLSQTYQVNYQWSESNDADFDEWGINVSCPTKDQLIYPAFDCQDMFTKMAGSNDPIMEILPYYGPRFRITATTADNKVTSVDIKLLICIDSEIPAYKAEAEKWLTKNGIDIKNYNLKFTSCD